MEAVRRLGMAGRFVSGYLYDPALDTGSGEPVVGEGVIGAGATHAWLDVYLPGAGWVPFDPTNAIFKGANLIRVAFARDPKLAAPLTGSWFGNPYPTTLEWTSRCRSAECDGQRPTARPFGR